MTDMRLVNGCPKWCTEDHTQQAAEDREHHAGRVRELRLPDGRLVLEASLTLEPGRTVPQLVVAGSLDLLMDDVQLLDHSAAAAFSDDLSRIASYVQSMVATLRSAEAQAPKKRKPKKRPLPPELQHCSRETRLYLAERDGRRCFYCQAPFDSLHDATTDHYIARSVWPCNMPANLVLACEPCNLAKADGLTWSMAAVLLAWSKRPDGEPESDGSSVSVALTA
ncbi:HNH endonuclease [Streptomyces sp. NPDC003688]